MSYEPNVLHTFRAGPLLCRIVDDGLLGRLQVYDPVGANIHPVDTDDPPSPWRDCHSPAADGPLAKEVIRLRDALEYVLQSLDQMHAVVEARKILEIEHRE